VNLRPELMPPTLDEALVARLADLAATLDGSPSGGSEDDVAAFNAEAGTSFAWLDFQGIYGAQDHDEWVRSVLAELHVHRVADITRAELVEMVRRVMSRDSEEYEVWFWLEMLEVNLPEPEIIQLIYYPGDYLGDGNNTRELTPEQIVDLAQGRASGDLA
jgi:hypothetical protein